MERPTFPTDRDVLDARAQQQSLEMFTALPGRVQSYDAATQLADIVPCIRHPVPQPDGTTLTEDLPVIPSVPVLWPRVGAWFLAMGLQPGDTVQLLFNSADIGPWLVGDGSTVNPADLRRHHLAHAVAIPGLYVQQRALAHAPAGGAGLVLGSDASGARVALLANGTLRITQGDATVLEVDTAGVVHLGGAAGELVALAHLVGAQLTALKTAINGAAVVPGDGGAAFKAAIMAALASWPSSTAATKTKAT
jgi:hypothetical protein